MEKQLQLALEQKEDELRQRGADLKISGYPGRGWAQKEIAMLNREIETIRAGELELARCRHQDDLCLIAHKGFDACALVPRTCGFSYKVKARQEQEVMSG